MNDRQVYLREKAAALPLCPGVYLMKNQSGQVIYVGKSRKMKQRVSSYFSGNDHSLKTRRMVALVYDFDWILCDTEMEALALENTLIKQHTPRYNIKLKDSKSYPYIKITASPYPKITVTRKRTADGGHYYGPYQSAAAAKEAADTVAKIFALPTCAREFPRDIGRGRPCLYREMGRCVAPCADGLTAEAYGELIGAARRVFEGHTKEAEALLERRMYDAADRELFELAAHYRNSLQSLQLLSQKQKVVSDPADNRDVFALYTAEEGGVLAVLQIRAGKLLYKQEYAFPAAALAEEADLAGLLFDYYHEGAELPKEVLLYNDLEPEAYTLLSDTLSRRVNRRISVKTPRRGPLRELCAMALANAKQKAESRREEENRSEKTLVKLARILSLEVLPHRIEVYDVSHIGAEHTTAAMVVAEGGKLKPAAYRTFRIRAAEGADDYAAMREVLSRRLAHVGDGGGWALPDLLLLDGGAGQVHAVAGVLAERGLSIPLFGLVKDEHHKTRVLTDGQHELSIAHEPGVYSFLYRLQEEVHRVAVRHTMGAKRRTLRRSALENIRGIGPAKAKRLLRAFGSLKQLAAATTEQLRAVKGISAADALAVRQYLQGSTPREEGRSAPSDTR
ncbi:MAG: excinuclease ABC subunit UvrC [Eubacteriales bacterium]